MYGPLPKPGRAVNVPEPPVEENPGEDNPEESDGSSLHLGAPTDNESEEDEEAAEEAAKEAAEEELNDAEDRVRRGTEPHAVRNLTTTWYVEALGFPELTAIALYEQELKDAEVLLTINDKMVEDICASVRKPGGRNKGHPTPVLAVERLKLAVFYVKLLERTSRPIPYLTTIKRQDINAVKDQKDEEDNYT